MKYGIVLILIGVAWCLGIKMRSMPVRPIAPNPTPPVTRLAESEPMVFDHCNFESTDLLQAMCKGQTVMITGSEIGPSTIAIPKGKVVVFKILSTETGR